MGRRSPIFCDKGDRLAGRHSDTLHFQPPELTTMQRIVSIDEQLTSLFSNFNKIADEIDIPFICNLSDERKIATLDYPGIYRIDVYAGNSPCDIGSWIAEFQSEWEHQDFKKKFTPNFKKKRIARHSELSEWMPLYLGKSKKICARVLEHINLELEKTTFALKIKARPSMAKREFRLHALEVPVQNYNLIVPTLEAAMRNRFNPLIGKQ
ncbi:MAG: hypothetical protein V4468_16885 [Pseudomonadota bacterium]